MFKLFNKDKKPEVIDRVFMHKQNKWSYCKRVLSENPKTTFIGWFDETIEEFENYLSPANLSCSILKARTTSRSQIEGSDIIFMEHYPMKSKEQQFLEALGIKEVIFLTALDEPLLKPFGGEKLIGIMEKMGLKEDEAIEHKMITQSIATAQEKIESKVSIEHSARSAAEWMERNFK